MKRDNRLEDTHHTLWLGHLNILVTIHLTYQAKQYYRDFVHDLIFGVFQYHAVFPFLLTGNFCQLYMGKTWTMLQDEVISVLNFDSLIF